MGNAAVEEDDAGDEGDAGHDGDDGAEVERLRDVVECALVLCG